MALEMSDDQLLDFTQRTRIAIVNDMTVDEEGVEKIPTDAKDRFQLMQLLTDIDKQAISKKRLVQQDKVNDAVVVAAKAIEMSFTKSDPEHPFLGRTIEHEATPIAPPELDLDVELVPNEMAVGESTQTYQDFFDDSK